MTRAVVLLSGCAAVVEFPGNLSDTGPWEADPRIDESSLRAGCTLANAAWAMTGQTTGPFYAGELWIRGPLADERHPVESVGGGSELRVGPLGVAAEWDPGVRTALRCDDVDVTFLLRVVGAEGFGDCVVWGPDRAAVLAEPEVRASGVCRPIRWGP